MRTIDVGAQITTEHTAKRPWNGNGVALDWAGG